MSYIRRDIPQVTASVVIWTKTQRALRVSINKPLLKELRWNRRTRVAVTFPDGVLALTKTKGGNRLHKRGVGDTLSAVTMLNIDGLKNSASRAVLHRIDFDRLLVDISALQKGPDKKSGAS